MQLDENVCYRAIASRDRRFEGHFVVAVTSTGIYCRPGCPARIPRRENTRFFAHPAAAEGAGFRPCRRCRPDSSPQTAAWQGTSSTVSRALRLIGDGALDDAGIDGLASRLGVGDRHLRRLFARHLGASPLSLARTRRAHFARKLLDETELPLSQIALAAGFRSLRRFNGVMLETFGQPPGSLRRKEGRGPLQGDSLSLRLPYRRPLDWDALLAFLRRRAIPGVEQVDDRTYRRTAGWGNWSGVLEVRPDDDQSCLGISLTMPPPGVLMQILARANRLFDLESDSRRIEDQLSADPELRPWIRSRPGLRVPGAWDAFELAVRAVLGQQVSVDAARTLAGRLAAAFGTRLQDSSGESARGLTLLFPSPERLATAELSALGMPAVRAAAIKSLSEALVAGRIRLDGSEPAAKVIAQLETLPGIGAWTAQYIAMRALRDPDAFPTDDLVLRRAFSRGQEPLTASELARKAEAWRPWRAYAAIHLWMGRT